jgi:hypothetical protein
VSQVRLRGSLRKRKRSGLRGITLWNMADGYLGLAVALGIRARREQHARDGYGYGAERKYFHKAFPVVTKPSDFEKP